MATWVTHLMIADEIMRRFPALDRRGFCVGNIAPDCNVENADWTAFTPSREVTHWMQSERKTVADCELFYREYLVNRAAEIVSGEQLSFLLGYYAHLIADAEFQRFIRDEERIRAVWQRIHACEALHERADGLSETWDSVKRLIPKGERMREIASIEAEYLAQHPDSGYLTEIIPLKEFPDYIDYLPHGCIVRKIGVMGAVPQKSALPYGLLTLSRAEYDAFVACAVERIAAEFTQKAIA